MSSPVVGSARVEITGDLNAFATSTQSGMAKAIKTVATDVDEGLDGIAADASESGEKTGTNFAAGLKGKIKSGLTSVKNAASGALGDLGLGASLAGAFTGAVNQAQNGAKLAGVLGLSPKDAATAAKTAGQVYADNWGESLDDVDDAIGNVQKLLGGLIPPGQTKQITEQALAFQQAFGVESQDSIKAVAQLMQTGLAKNAQDAFDILTTGEQNGADKAGDLLDTFNEYSVQFKKLGLDGTDALGLIQQGLQGGARDSDLVADSLKEFSLRAVDGSTTTAQGFAMIGLNAKDMSEKIGAGGTVAKGALEQTLTAIKNITDPVKRAQAASALFGSQAEDLGQALFALDPATAGAAKGMDQVQGSGQKMADSLSASSNPLDTLKRSVMGTFTTIGSKAIPVIVPLLSLLSKLGPEVTAVALAFAGMAAVSKVVGLFRTFNEVVLTAAAREKIVAAATKAWTAATWLFNAAMDANPITLIILAIVALGVALYEAYQHIGPVRDAMNDVGKAFLWVWQNVLSPVVDFFKRNWKEALNIAIDVFLPFIGLPVEIIRHWSTVVDWFSHLFGWIAGFFTHAAKWLYNAGASIIDGMLQGLKDGWDATMSWFEAIPGDIEQAAEYIASGFWNGLKSLFTEVGNIGRDLYNSLARTLNNDLIDPIKGWHFTIGVAGISHTFQPFGSIPDIPYLAKGGMSLGPMAAVIGDNPSGNELVAPLDSPRTVDLLAKAMARAGSSTSAQLSNGTGQYAAEFGAAFAQHLNDPQAGRLDPTVAKLLDAVMKAVTRPVEVKVGKQTVATAANDGNRELARRAGGNT